MDQELKVLVISSIFPNNIEQNKGIYIYYLVRELAKICRVKVIAPVPYSPKFIKKGKYSLFSRVLKKETYEGLEVMHPGVLIIPKTGRSIYGYLFALSLIRKVQKLKKSFQPDIILNYWAYPDGFASVLIGKILSVPVIIGGRGCDINDTKGFPFKKMVSWTIKECNHLLAVSTEMKVRMKELGACENKISVIPNGIDNRFRPMDKRESRQKMGIADEDGRKKIILYCGRLSPEKGITYLINSAKLMMDSKEPFRLLLVGEGEQKRRITDLISNMGLGQCAEIRSEVPHEQMPILMNCADIFCLPSIREGWPNVVMEALACGVPVVASKVGGVPEILSSQDYGIMVLKENAEALADGLMQAMQKVWVREKIVEAVKDQTWEKAAGKVYKEIKTTLSE